MERFPGFAVLAGADPLMLPLLRKGGAGCITATSNLVAADLGLRLPPRRRPRQGRRGRGRPGARRRRARTQASRFAQMASLKALLAHATGHAGLDPPAPAPAAADGRGSARRFSPLTRTRNPQEGRKRPCSAAPSCGHRRRGRLAAPAVQRPDRLAQRPPHPRHLPLAARRRQRHPRPPARRPPLGEARRHRGRREPHRRRRPARHPRRAAGARRTATRCSPPPSTRR